MKKHVIGALAALAFILTPVSSQAAGITEAQIQAILDLLTSFGAETSVVSNVNASLRGQVSGSRVSSQNCIELRNSLYADMTDERSGGEVSKLQRFLGVDTTGYYGPQTEQAVQRWQAARGIVSSGSPETTGYGFVGPRTRSAMACTNTNTTRKVGGVVNEAVIPVADAGPDRTIYLPTNSVVPLGPSVRHSEYTTVTYAWTLRERDAGTNVPVITNAKTLTPKFSSLSAGEYIFRLTVTDNLGRSDTDDVKVTVQSPTNPATTAADQCPNISGVQSSVPSGYSKGAFGNCTPPRPTMYSASCNAAGTQATLSWSRVDGATGYPFRVDDMRGRCMGSVSGPYSSAPCGVEDSNTDFVSSPATSMPGTSVTVNVTPGVPYQWWVHAYAGGSATEPDMWSGYSKASFTCSSSPTPTTPTATSCGGTRETSRSVTVRAEGTYGPSGNVYGSKPFSTNSWLGNIALWLGARPGSTATLAISDAGCITNYHGSSANGVTTLTSLSQPWWGMNVTCTSGCSSETASTATSCPGTPATAGSRTVTANASGGTVWGRGPFTVDSSLASIARFLGAPQGGSATLSISNLGCRSSYSGATQNSVTASSYGSYQGMDVTCTSGCSTAETGVPLSSISQPIMYPVSCQSSGTKVILSWGSVSGAEGYPFRVDDTRGRCMGSVSGPYSSAPCGVEDSNTDFVSSPATAVTGNTATMNISPGVAYEWWVHAYKAGVWSPYTKASFTCPAT